MFRALTGTLLVSAFPFGVTSRGQWVGSVCVLPGGRRNETWGALKATAFGLLLLAVSLPGLAAEVAPRSYRYVSPDGWVLVFTAQFDTPDKLETLRSTATLAAAPLAKMVLDTQDEYDWLQCTIAMPEGISVFVGPNTRVIFRRDSLDVVSRGLVFTDRSAMQYWDSRGSEIALGLAENADIYAMTGKVSLPGAKTKVRAISYGAFVIVPDGSGINKSSVKEVKVTGVRVEKKDAR